MKLVYQGKVIEYDTNHVLGSGGEANIVKASGLAFKIYHEPSVERAQKLRDFLDSKFDMPANVLGPIDVTTDMKGKVNGFAMKIAPKGTLFIELSNISYRSMHRLTTDDVVTLFFNAKTSLDQIHNNPTMVVGDMNDVNQLFTDKLDVYYIDVDSFQFGKYPCFVGTDTFIDPNLYGVDLTKKPSFSKQTDWYAFAVMLFKSLLFVHPYGGMHPQYKTMIRRAQQKIWALDKKVIYPKNGLHPEILGDDLLDYFSKIFAAGQRIELQTQQLQTLMGSFIECKSCGVYFSKTRLKCPQCQKAAPQQAIDLTGVLSPKQVDKERCEATTLFQTTGVILFAKVIQGKLIVVYFENGNTRFMLIGENYKQCFTLWSGFEKQFKYECFSLPCLVVNHDNNLMMFDVHEGKLTTLTQLTTTEYDNNAVFSCSDNYLYRLTNNAVLKCQALNSQVVCEEVTAAMEDQTWLRVGPNDLGLGMFRIFNKHQYFVFSRSGRYEVEMDELNGQVIDMDVAFSVDCLILLRKSLHNGRTFSHWHIIDSKGKVLETKSEESLNSELLRNIHGKLLAGSSIVHATDEGVVIEKHGAMTLKSSTAEFVNSGHSLQFYKQGLLAISTNSISYLVLR